MRSAVDSAKQHGIELRKRVKTLLREDDERRETTLASSLMHSLREMHARCTNREQRTHERLYHALESAYFEVEAD